MLEKIKVLVVDDSALVRKIITDILESDPEISVIGTANNGKTAIFRAQELNPDIITMDIEMPIMDGLSALKYIIENNPKPVIMMSVLTQHGADATFKALEIGAVDFIPKPSTAVSLSINDIADLLISKVKSVIKSKITISKKTKLIQKNNLNSLSTLISTKTSSLKVVGIGTSTGGPSALIDVFKGFPKNFPSPVLVVQHMPEGFTRAFSERLNGISNLNVKEAEDGDIVLPGCAFVAPGHSHIVLERKMSENIIRLSKGEKVSGHRPSIDVMFNSLAEIYKKNIVATIMTGMGRDGATGIGQIKNLGGYTIAQNEESSVVYGMNRVAVEERAINAVVPLHEITKKIIDNI